MSNDISIDCETLGKMFDAPVIAIGARAFDRMTGKLGAKFYIEIELASAIKTGRVDGSTIGWWIMQSPRAKVIFDPDRESKKSSMATALVEFSHWCIGQGKDTNQQSGVLHAWSNGAAQDITWLEHAYTVGGHGLTIPWQYNMSRDLRTIEKAATDIAGFDRATVKPVGVEHNAVDDATYQANIIIAAYKALRGSKTTPVPTDDDEL
jgi:exodeoxyribonuclease VIII